MSADVSEQTHRHTYRSHRGADLVAVPPGTEVRLSGWVVAVRDLGRLAFVTLRDASGVMQLVARDASLVDACRALSVGSAVTVDGVVGRRPARDARADDALGSLEVRLRRLTVLPSGFRARWDDAERVRPPLAGQARASLGGLGFDEADGAGPGPLSDHLIATDRVFRLRRGIAAEQTVPSGASPTDLLELELGFASIEELGDAVTELGRVLVSAAVSVATVSVTGSEEWSEALAKSAGGAVVVLGLPLHGVRELRGLDLPLVLLAAADEGPVANIAQAALLLVAGRVVGAGGVRAGTAGATTEWTVGGRPDPVGWEELAAASDPGSAAPAGSAWFVADLGRVACALRSPVQAGHGPWAEEPGGGACLGQVAVPDPAHDLGSVLRAAFAGRHRSHRARLHNLDDEARKIARWDIEASAAMARSRARGPSAEGSQEGFARLLADFSMEPEVCELLFDLLPQAGARLRSLPAGERFEWTWSVLGSPRVRAVLQDPTSYLRLRTACDEGVATDLAQLTHLDGPALAQLSSLLEGAENGTGARDQIRALLRRALADSPSSFTGLVAALAAHAGTAEELARRPRTAGLDDVGQLLASGLATPGLLPALLSAADLPGAARTMTRAIRLAGRVVLRNVPLDEDALAGRIVSAVAQEDPGFAARLQQTARGELVTSALAYLFRPVSLTFAEQANVLAKTRDCSSQVSASGLHPGGRDWSEADQCYKVGPVGGGAELRLYLSKNQPSVLAKASVGICTAQDVALFHRSDHHHLNLVDPATDVVVGNAQVHLLEDRGARILLVRALNATGPYLARGAARAVVEATLVSCVQLAIGSEVDEVHLVESLSFWHINSSRPQIRAVLESLYQELPSGTLERPHHLFRFGEVDLEVQKTYRLWARRQGRADFRFGGFLEVVT